MPSYRIRWTRKDKTKAGWFPIQPQSQKPLILKDKYCAEEFLKYLIKNAVGYNYELVESK